MPTRETMPDANISSTVEYVEWFEYIEHWALGANMSSIEWWIYWPLATMAWIIPQRMSLQRRWPMFLNRSNVDFNAGFISKLGAIFNRRKGWIERNGTINNSRTSPSKHSITTIFVRLLYKIKSTNSRDITEISDANIEYQFIGAYSTNV